jgi:hypothetical protein
MLSMVATRYSVPRGVLARRAPLAPIIQWLRKLCANIVFHFTRRNHFTRPLEEAIQVHQSQWPKAWEGKNPLHGGRTFATMSPEERVRF